MEGVSEIDANFGLLFRQIWTKLQDEQKKIVINYFKEKLAERTADVSKTEKTFPTEHVQFKDLMDKDFVSAQFDTSTRWKILKKMLELSNHNRDSVKVFLRLFNHDGAPGPIVPLRNSYGHRTRATLEKDHTHDKCVAIRRELRMQAANVGKMIKDSES